MIELRTLGTLELRGCDPQGVEALLSQPKRLGLLAYLAIANPQGFHRRDRLLALFWPESDQTHARAALRNALSFLRHQLGEAVIVTRGDEVRLDPATFWCDVTAFLACADAKAAGEALALYGGDLLAGFHVADAPDFEGWLEGERNHFRGRAAEAAWALAVIEERAGDWVSAAGYARRAVTLSPDYEQPACRLIELLDRAGDRGAALQEYDTLERRLAREQDVRPSPESLSVIQAIRMRATSHSPTSNPPTAAPADRFTTPGEDAAPRRRSLGARRRWGVAVGLAALAAAGVLLFRSRPASLTDPNLLAIAPFDVLDPSLQIWHEGLVDILSRDLDGAGPLRTVPQTVGIKRWRGRADRVSAESFGHRTGAGLVVFGSVRKARDTVSLRATVLDLVGKRMVPDLEVKGDTADIGDLADSLGIRILQVLGRDRPIGSVRQVSIGSSSLPALKAFLYGEQFYRRGLWDSALVYYDQATRQDSTFALAFRRMAVVLGWHPASSDTYRSDEEYRRRSVTLNHRLSPRDSLLIVADSLNIAAGDATDPADLLRFRYRAFSTLEEAARRYPGDPEVWYHLGDARFHGSPPLGGVPGPALEAFDYAIALDPGFAPAYEHTVNLAIRLNRSDLARQYADAYLRLDPTDVNASSIRLAALMLDPNRADAPETARMIDTSPARVLFDAGLGHLGDWPDSSEVAVRLLRALTTRSGTGADFASDTLMYPQILAIELAYRGHLHEAYAVDRRLLLDPRASRFSNVADPFLWLSLLGVIPDSLAASTYGRALEPGKAWYTSPFFTDRQQRGLPWWLARSDTASIARFALRAEREARMQESARGKLQGRYLHAAATAYLALARADSVSALHLFQAIPDTLCVANSCFYGKLIEARLLASQGQARQAGALLDRWVWNSGALFGLGVLEQGRIAEGLGERQKAIDAYQFVVDVWRGADPELQPFVVEARNALVRLTRE